MIDCFRRLRLALILSASALASTSALAITYLESDADLLNAAVPPKVLAMLSGSQVSSLKTAMYLATMPATPEELGRMLTIASQFVRSDPEARAHLDALMADNAKWIELARGNPPPADMQSWLGLVYQKQNMLPVLSQLTQLQGKTAPFEPLVKMSDTVSRSPFGVQALRVRKGFADLIVEEQSKADRHSPGAREVLIALRAPGAAAATAQLDKAGAAGSAVPSCDEVVWLPALASEQGARKTATGWEKPEVPCK